jgi:hypothetical protein
VDSADIYLQKDSAYAMAQKVTPAGAGVMVSDRTLFKRLQDCGFLRSWDTKRERNYIRKRIGGTDQSVLHLSARVLGVSLI